jgi:proteasome assembly chaperone (PAC2) family protein
VVGVASDAETAKLLEKYNVELLNNGMIVGMNGLLVALAAVRNLKGFCLLGTTSGGILDAKATKAVLEALANILGFKLNVGNLDKFVPTLPKAKLTKAGLPEPSAEEVTYIR